MPDHSFPPKLRLRSASDFRIAFDEGKKIKAFPVLAFVRPNGLGHNRLGLAVSKRNGNAPRRNRIKRLFREAFRLVREDVPVSYDLVLIPMDHRREYDLDDVKRRIGIILEKAASET